MEWYRHFRESKLMRRRHKCRCCCKHTHCEQEEDLRMKYSCYYYGKVGDYDVYTTKPRRYGAVRASWRAEQWQRDNYGEPYDGDGKVRKVPFWE